MMVMYMQPKGFFMITHNHEKLKKYNIEESKTDLDGLNLHFDRKRSLVSLSLLKKIIFYCKSVSDVVDISIKGNRVIFSPLNALIESDIKIIVDEYKEEKSKYNEEPTRVSTEYLYKWVSGFKEKGFKGYIVKGDMTISLNSNGDHPIEIRYKLVGNDNEQFLLLAPRMKDDYI